MGLPISETTFGRETELAQLSSAYDRSVSDKTEASIIFGHSGTGKSVLAYRLGATIQSRGGTFISGKFDFLQQRKPFLAVGMAFNQYCEILVEQGKAATIGCKLRSALGDEIVHLVQVIPKLSNIISDSACAVQSIDNAIDPGRRLLHLFTEFVRIIAETSDMALFLDGEADVLFVITPKKRHSLRTAFRLTMGRHSLARGYSISYHVRFQYTAQIFLPRVLPTE